MLQPTPGSENRKKLVIGNLKFLLHAVPLILIATSTGGAIGSAMAFDAADRRHMTEVGAYDNLVWPLALYYRGMDKYADFIDSYWTSLLWVGVIALLWWAFAYTRWGSFLPRRTTR